MKHANASAPWEGHQGASSLHPPPPRRVTLGIRAPMALCYVRVPSELHGYGNDCLRSIVAACVGGTPRGSSTCDQRDDCPTLTY